MIRFSGNTESSTRSQEVTSILSTDRQWDLKGLKSETSRLYLRAFKKVAKINERLAKYRSRIDDIDELTGTENDPEVLQIELEELDKRLQSLKELEDGLKNIRSISDSRFSYLATLASSLNVTDQAPQSQPRGDKKPKGKAPPPRKPYFEYLSVDGIVIRVGRAASDNDMLSCDVDHRDDGDWWMHVTGFPGSHVVIRYTADDLPQKHPESFYDAAILAAVNSKGPQTGKVPVTFTRCRDVRKPVGAKPGLVQLKGNVGVVNMFVNSEAKRLARLEASKIIPTP